MDAPSITQALRALSRYFAFFLALLVMLIVVTLSYALFSPQVTGVTWTAVKALAVAGAAAFVCLWAISLLADSADRDLDVDEPEITVVEGKRYMIKDGHVYPLGETP